MKNIIYILVLCFATLTSSCKTQQQVPIPTQNSTVISSEKAPEKIVINDSFALPRQQNSWYSSRLSVEISTSGTDEISAFIVNRRDSIIYININKFGIELARAVLTPDSITMVNRFEKTYYKGDYSIITKLYGFSLTFDMIQSILISEDFKDFTANSITEKSSDSTQIISIPRRINSHTQSSFHQEITLQKSQNKIINNWIKDIKTQQVANISYLEFENIDSFIFPQLYLIELPGTKIKISTKSTRVNISGPTSLIVPSKYSPMFP